MARIVVSQNITLDGVVQDPTGDEGRPFGGWFNRITPADREAWAELETAEAMNAEALLMGRRSYEYFAARWPARTGAWADRLNALPKYVVTSTLDDLKWANSVPVTADSVAKLKQSLDGDIVVNGSAQLAHTLLRNDLVDELRLIVFPSLTGAGTRLFPEPGATRSLRLRAGRNLGDGLTFLTYEPVRDV
ncbi:dihydrofolate reductase family protein [Actinoplanes sp. NPDC051513]|uniref:dihydrofolate reductase family protein n=1 Tax=Actinoplanes sp. NPDC051513 TaxID=3363908 RepID=UPI003798AA01